LSGFPKVGDCFQNRYEILSILGSGGFGCVFKARQLDGDRLVALKVLRLVKDNSFYARFLREAKALSRICHLNVVTVYHCDITQDDLPFLAMEFIEGTDVRKLLNDNGPLPVVRALMIIKQCADAMAYVHGKGIVHRDLKLENIMLVDEPEPDTVKLVDFGLVRLSDEKTITGPGSMLGTVDYISPELAAGKRTDHRSDQYSLCVCLYEMLCGKTPFKSDSPIEVMSRHIHEPVPAITSGQLDFFHPDINKVINRGMAKEPENRFRDMTELSQSLSRLIETIESSGTAGRVGQRAPAFKNLSAVLFVLSIAALVIFLGVRFFHNGADKQSGKIVKQAEKDRTMLPDRSKRIRCSYVNTIEDRVYSLDKKKALAVLDEYLMSSDRLDSDARALLLTDKISFCPPEEGLNYAKQAFQLAEREYQLCHRGSNDDLFTWVYVSCASIYLERLLALGHYREVQEISDRLLPICQTVGDFNVTAASRSLRTLRAGDLQVWAAAAAVGMHDYKTANRRMDTLRSYQGGYTLAGLNATILLKLNRFKDVCKLAASLSRVSGDADGIYALGFVQEQRFKHFQDIMEIVESCRMASRYDLVEQCLKSAEKVHAIMEATRGAGNPAYDDTSANLAQVELSLARIGIQLSTAKKTQTKKAVLDTYTKWSKLTVSEFKSGQGDYPRLCAINLVLYLLECGAKQEAEQLLAEIMPYTTGFAEPSMQISGKTADLEARLAKFHNNKYVQTFMKALHSQD